MLPPTPLLVDSFFAYVLAVEVHEIATTLHLNGGFFSKICPD
jgi:hypothetical protein